MKLYTTVGLLILGIVGAAAADPSGAYMVADTKLDTSSMSFYGFYGFYGFEGTPNPLFCDVVEVKFTLYNYGAHDLTSINTIQYIIDQTKEAVALTIKQAAPTSSDDDYVVTVTELDGSSVTFVTVTAEIDFQEGGIDDITKARALGGQFAAAVGITDHDTMYGDAAPTDGVCSLGFDVIVSGYQQAVLQKDENAMVAFQSAMQSAWQSAIYMSTHDDKAAAAATIELVGITDADANDIAVRLFLHFAQGKDTCKDFEGQILADSYSMSDRWGILAGRIRIVETTNETTDRRRSLLQAGTVGTGANLGTAEKNILSINVAKAGMGVNSIEPGSAECKIIDGLVDSDSTGKASSDGAVGTSDGPATSDSAEAGPNVSTELDSGGNGNNGNNGSNGSNGANGATGSNGATGGAAAAGATATAGDSGSDSADYHSFYGFYGSSDDSSFYGVYGVASSEYGYGSSAAGAASSAAPGGGSSAGGGGSSSGGGGGGDYSSAMATSFYGYTDSSPSKPPSSDSSSPPAAPKPYKPSAPAPKTPAAPQVNYYPVYFTTFLSDYTMEDLSGAEDMAQFRSDYVAAVDNAIQLLGITSGPSIGVLDVYAASVAVDTLVTFEDDAAGADLLMQVLSQNPSLAFPAFSSLGSVTITDVRSNPSDSAPDMATGGSDPAYLSTPGPSTCSQQGILDKDGECCLPPHSLDAEMSCCFEDVDECGICGGDGSSCALSAVVRVSTPADADLEDKASVAFATFVANFKEGLAVLFSSYGIDVSNVEIDEAGIVTSTDVDGNMVMDIPFKLYPHSNGATVPSVVQAENILKNAAEANMTHKDITLEEVLSVGRAGVCGNGFCEIGEMLPADETSGDGLCSADCPGVLSSCPAGGSNAVVGDKFESCAGNGGCALSTGKCNCDDGYTGDSCGVCSEGFTAMNGMCHKDSVMAATERDAGVVAPTESNNTTSIILGVVFGIIALIIIALFVYWLLVLRKRRDASREEGLAFSSQQQVPASNEEPDIPTRQVAENTV